MHAHGLDRSGRIACDEAIDNNAVLGEHRASFPGLAQIQMADAVQLRLQVLDHAPCIGVTGDA